MRALDGVRLRRADGARELRLHRLDLRRARTGLNKVREGRRNGGLEFGAAQVAASRSPSRRSASRGPPPARRRPGRGRSRSPPSPPAQARPRLPPPRARPSAAMRVALCLRADESLADDFESSPTPPASAHRGAYHLGVGGRLHPVLRHEFLGLPASLGGNGFRTLGCLPIADSCASSSSRFSACEPSRAARRSAAVAGCAGARRLHELRASTSRTSSPSVFRARSPELQLRRRERAAEQPIPPPAPADDSLPPDAAAACAAAWYPA